MTTYFKINDKDFSSLVSGLRVSYETLVSDKSGRNAAGNTFVDVINKKYKVHVTLRHTIDSEMKAFLSAIENYIVNISFLNPKTGVLTTINVYTGTPEPEYYTIQPGTIVYKPMDLNFIEL